MSRQSVYGESLLFHVPESNSDEPAARKQHDFNCLSFICEKIELKEELPVVKIIRLGKYSEDKCRPLLVTFSNLFVKDKILRSSFKCKDISFFGVPNHVAVTPDRSPAERAERNCLVNELKQRRLNGETNLYIRRNKLVNIRDY